MADELRTDGNTLFKSGDFASAIEKWLAAHRPLASADTHPYFGRATGTVERSRSSMLRKSAFISELAGLGRERCFSQPSLDHFCSRISRANSSCGACRAIEDKGKLEQEEQQRAQRDEERKKYESQTPEAQHTAPATKPGADAPPNCAGHRASLTGTGG